MATNNPVPTNGLAVRVTGLQRHGTPYQNELGELHVELPERVPFVLEYDSITYICKGSEYLADVVASKYKGLVSNPLDLLDVVAQFQEEPIIDVSVKLEANRVLLLPPMTYVQGVAFGDSLADFPKIA